MEKSFVKEIFEKELQSLLQEKLITQEEYENVRAAHARYRAVKESNEIVRADIKEMKPHQQEMDKQSQKYRPVYKKVMTAQEIRDRNITTVLILGVFLVLLSGIVLATSNWDIMNSTVKTLAIVLVAAVFFAVSWFSEAKLKIYKTSFAFWVMGSMLIPIAVLSVGFFQLLGPWLSVFGKGRYILGLLGTTIGLPVYIYSCYKYKNRSFVWLSLISISAGISFALAAFSLPTDVYYLGIIVFNSMLLIGYVKFNRVEKIKIFVKELPVFVQANLILSTMLILIIFDSRVFYGINVILLSAVYLAVIFINEKTEYSYVSGALLIYGVYQFTENSRLVSVDILIFSMLGFVFLAFEKYLAKDVALKKIFTYISAAASAIVFIYIFVITKAEVSVKPSYIIFAAYILTALNYFYLSYKTEKNSIGFLAISFLMTAGSESYRLLSQFFGILNFHYDIYMTLVVALVFTVFFYKNKWKFTSSVKIAGGILPPVFMTFLSIYSLIHEKWLILSLILYLCAYMSYGIYKEMKIRIICSAARWIMPVAFYGGTVSLYGRLFENIPGYDIDLHCGLAAAVVFALSIYLRKIKSCLSQYFMWLSNIFITFSWILYFTDFYTKGIKLPVVLVIAIAIYILSALLSKNTEIFARLFLYSAFTTGYILLTDIMKNARVAGAKVEYSTFIAGVIILIIWFVLKGIWKSYTLSYVIAFSIYGLLLLDYQRINSITDFIIFSVYTVLLLYSINISGVWVLNLVPILLFIPKLGQLYETIFKYNIAGILFTEITVFFALKISGEILSKRLYTYTHDKDISITFIDWYAVGALLIALISSFYTGQQLWALMISPLLTVYLLYSQIKRVEMKGEENIILTLMIISIMYPYYTLTANINVPSIINREINLLPWIAVVIVCKRVWPSHRSFLNLIESIILGFTAFLLIMDIAVYSYITDAIILGVLCLISIITGIQLKLKSFFFTGSFTLLANVILQTKHFWGRLPWWIYLLGAGLILIATASINEIQKNNRDNNLRELIKKLSNRFKEWE